MSLLIAALRDDQVEALSALARHIWLQHYPGIISPAQIDYMLNQRYNAAAIRQHLHQPGSGWDVAQQDSSLIGFVHYCLDTEPQRLKLDKLYVHPDWQRRGVGAALLARVEAAARRQQRSVIQLRTNKHNHLALAAYRKYGFEMAAEVVTDIGGGFVMDDYVLEKTLA
ncbi:GNAT family N-acetyltransferase [Sulfuriferula sp.]|uniref:GNAT family N-acetyltransferase n=1 Tax=Sulfuriferula sp. TaxID=2025307 RepID=UPI0027300835|nr:GNAT family N-acetyltransferase [Sulfuriferula sp.]MDP2027915.1 GNAT family N-acetyltransferase [Sulfuriferula sp.]